MVMNRSIQVFSIAFMLALASAVNAQTPPCGIVEVVGPTKLDAGTPWVIKAKFANLPTSTPEFKWWVSGGKIIKGEGTDEITVDTTGLVGFVITATASLATMTPEGCHRSASISLNISHAPPPERHFDSYGDLTLEEEKARLEGFATVILKSPPGSRGLIQKSAGQSTFEREAWYRLDHARVYLFKSRGIEASRVETIDCGFTKSMQTTLWIIPPGAKFPECPKANAIPRSEMRYTKPFPTVASPQM